MSFASLHSGLLVRKGDAAPSATGAVGFPPPKVAAPSIDADAALWLAERRDVPGQTPPAASVPERLGRGIRDFAQSPTGRPRRPDGPALQLVERVDPPPALVPPEPTLARRARAPAASRVVLTLSPERERRLNLAAARLGQPRARLVTQALDALLDGLGDGPLKDCRCYRGEAGGDCCS